MPAFSAGAAIISGNKQAKAVERSSDAQIAFAEDTRDLAIAEADRSYRTGQRVLQNSSRDLRQINRENYEATGGVIDRGYRDLRNATATEFERTGALINSGFDDQMRIQNALRGELIGDGGFEESPGYNFRRQEALDAVQASAAARGGLFSGATGKRLTEVADGYAADEWDRYRNDLRYLSENESAIYDWRTGALVNRQQDRADDLRNIFDWRTGAQLDRENQFTAAREGIRAGRADASLNLLANRTNARVGAGATANSTVANALSDRAIGQANAFTTQVNGVTQGVQNGIRLWGAFG